MLSATSVATFSFACRPARVSSSRRSRALAIHRATVARCTPSVGAITNNGVEGILVLGDVDFTLDPLRGCYVTHACAEDGSDCDGEYALRAAHLRQML